MLPTAVYVEVLSSFTNTNQSRTRANAWRITPTTGGEDSHSGGATNSAADQGSGSTEGVVLSGHTAFSPPRRSSIGNYKRLLEKGSGPVRIGKSSRLLSSTFINTVVPIRDLRHL